MSNETWAHRVVDAAYTATVNRLQGDAEFESLKAAALREAAQTPDRWFARNRLWLQVEIETPL